MNRIRADKRYPLPEIMATVADNRCTPEFLGAIFREGATQVRVNTAHVEPSTFARMVRTIREVRPETPVLMDTKGPEIRTSALADGLPEIRIRRGDRFRLCGDSAVWTTRDTIGLSFLPGGLLRPGDRIFVDDALLEFAVVGFAADGTAVAEAMNAGTLGSRKSVNLPGVDISALPAVTERDEANLRMAVRLGISTVAHSFVRSADDVRRVRAILDDEAGGRSTVSLVSKIECRSALDNFSEILRESDGLLVARGDLGMEVAPELIPSLQAETIRRCHDAGKPVIVATQFLNSMMTAPRPTRAEISDIALAAAEGASVLLLCGETAAGAYPAEAVAAMRRAIEASTTDGATLLH
ncbi:MAG: pyruvate kinase [Clostridium sp.]|nr:pyruvate kinase [Clostridium sp.]